MKIIEYRLHVFYLQELFITSEAERKRIKYDQLWVSSKVH